MPPLLRPTSLFGRSESFAKAPPLSLVKISLLSLCRQHIQSEGIPFLADLKMEASQSRFVIFPPRGPLTRSLRLRLTGPVDIHSLARDLEELEQRIPIPLRPCFREMFLECVSRRFLLTFSHSISFIDYMILIHGRDVLSGLCHFLRYFLRYAQVFSTLEGGPVIRVSHVLYFHGSNGGFMRMVKRLIIPTIE